VVTDTELVKSGGEVDRVPRKEISMDTIECSINLHTISLINLVCTPLSWLNPTHQKGNVSIFKEVFVMSRERVISCISPLVGAR
jgi:hypothetical protein